jgi:thiol-disulfide isomerase/thioredoxin
MAASLTGVAFAENMIKTAGSRFINAAGEKIKKAPSEKIVGFYFSAHWCPPCRKFTPKLVEFYSNLKQEGKEFEIIFVSADKGEDEMLAYMKETSMPWLAIPYNSTAIKALKEKLNISGIPALVIVCDGQVITKQGRDDVENSGSTAYEKWLYMAEPLKKSSKEAPSEISNKQLPAPEEKEMKFSELTAQIIDLNGKVVKTTINFVTSFNQTGQGEYSALCAYRGGSDTINGEFVKIPEKGNSFFQELAKKNNGDGGEKTIYLFVCGKTLEAVGTRYKKDKGEYSW